MGSLASALARALVIGNARADLLPPAVSQWIEVAATYGANTIDLARTASRLRQLHTLCPQPAPEPLS